MSLKQQWDKLLELSPEEQNEVDAQLLAHQFLSIVNAEMQKQKMTKKELALKVDTSPSFITQLFSGDRKPSWSLLVKFANVFQLNFEISTSSEIEQRIQDEIVEYHRKWVKTQDYFSAKKETDKSAVLTVISHDQDYALAG